MSAVEELFATETMAELCARQGRVGDALSIYRRLLAGGAGDDRCAKWTARLAALETAAGSSGIARVDGEGAPGARPAGARAPQEKPPAETHRMPLVVRQPVRSGQVIYAENNDLIVLAPVNPGAQLIADGNIHVYAPLRGRAVAGAHGRGEARIFCQRLEAELVGIDAAYMASDDLPAERLGRAAQIYLQDGRCVVASL